MSEADAFLAPLRTGRVCFDATVPRHFAQSGYGRLLVACFGGRTCWPGAVEAELKRQIRYAPDLASFVDGRFGNLEPILESEEDEVTDLQLEQLTRAEYRAKPTTHRGEAECVVVCKRLGLPWVVHDRGGRNYALKREGARYLRREVITQSGFEGTGRSRAVTTIRHEDDAIELHMRADHRKHLGVLDVLKAKSANPHHLMVEIEWPTAGAAKRAMLAWPYLAWFAVTGYRYVLSPGAAFARSLLLDASRAIPGGSSTQPPRS